VGKRKSFFVSTNDLGEGVGGCRRAQEIVAALRAHLARIALPIFILAIGLGSFSPTFFAGICPDVAE
jgi:hypothetical protein